MKSIYILFFLISHLLQNNCHLHKNEEKVENIHCKLSATSLFKLSSNEFKL